MDIRLKTLFGVLILAIAVLVIARSMIGTRVGTNSEATTNIPLDSFPAVQTNSGGESNITSPSTNSIVTVEFGGVRPVFE